MKTIQLFTACMFYCLCAMAQAPAVVFDPISVSTFSANGNPGYLGPVDHSGNIYVAGSSRVSRISPSGITTAIAGTGTPGFVDGPGVAAQFSDNIGGLALDAAGNIYVADGGNNSIRKITTGGSVSTLAGNASSGYVNGIGGAARFNLPRGIAADAAGNIFVGDGGNYSVRKITPAGVVTTFAGNGSFGTFTDMYDLAFDAAGNLYVQQLYGQLKKITPAGAISTVYPPGFYGFKQGLTADKLGNLYLSKTGTDALNSVLIYKIFPGGDAASLAGSGNGYRDSVGAFALFNVVNYVTIDDTGNVYAAEGSRIRKLSKPKLSFATNAGAASITRFFAVSGNNLTGPANVQAPSGYELSLNEAGPFSTTLSVPSAAGEIKVVYVYIRLTANVLAGVYNDSVVLSSGGAVTKKLGVSGTVTNSPRKLVIIGSGTSACIGVSPATDCYVNRLSSFYNKVGPFDTTIDNTLARGSTNCYNGMPSSYVSPYSAASGYTPIKEINITAALALHPNAILVNYPTNGYDALSVNEIMFCLRTIRDSANKQGVPCFITSTQPRTSPAAFNTAAMKLKLAVLKDSILAAFGPFAIDFWTGLINPADSSLLYDSGDHTNMNGAGHNILYQRVLAANVFSKTLPVAEAGTGLQAVYYNDMFLATSVLTRVDPVVNIDLAAGVSPAPGFVNADNYSVQWSGQVTPLLSETYNFYTLTDKGVRLYVNNVLLIEDWANNSGNMERTASINLVAGQKYNIVMQYYHQTGNAVAKLSWSGAGTPKAIIPKLQLFPTLGFVPPPAVPACATNTAPVNGAILNTTTSATLSWTPVTGATEYYVYLWTGPDPAPPVLPSTFTAATSVTMTGLAPSSQYKWYVLPYNSAFTATGCGTTNKTTFTTAPSSASGSGLQGVYYNGITLSGTPLLTRIDPTINFELTYAHPPLSPAPGIVPEDNYSVRWTGQVQALFSETYTFYTLSDDGIRLWVNGVQLVNNFVSQGATEKSGSITLVAGQKYDIVIEYFEGTGEAVTKLYWSGPSTAKAIVPQAQLFPPGASAPACVINTSPANAAVLPSQTSARLTWPASAGATSYDVYLATGNAVPTLLKTNTTALTYYATGLTAGILYSWYIAPRNANGANTACGATNKTTFTTATATGGGNIAPVANAGSSFSITLPVTTATLNGTASYDPNGSIAEYYWYQAQGPVTASITNFSVTPAVTGLTTAGTYIFGLQVKDNNGVPAYSSVTVTVKPAGSADARIAGNTESLKTVSPDNSPAFAFTTAAISPNPVKRGQAARLQINSDRTGTALISLTGSNGQQISNQRISLLKGINNTSVSTAALSQGLYLVNITGGSKPITVKLIVD